MTASVFVKICGVISLPDAIRAVDLGADAVGVNLVPTSKRRVSEAFAADVVRALRGRAQVVAVVADLTEPELRGIAARTGVDRLQLHGDEPPGLVEALSPLAFKAIRLGGADDVDRAVSMPGEPLLVDAYAPGELGGTGRLADWALAARLAARRRVLLAGGLREENVGEAVTRVRPWGVDVASGVEVGGSPGVKDWSAVRGFIAAARA